MTLPELKRMARRQAVLVTHHLSVLEIIRTEIRAKERRLKKRKS